MIADDRRRSRIANRRSQTPDNKESCFHVIADDRKRSKSRLLHTFRTAEVSKFMIHASCARKSQQNKMADVEGEILLQANLFFP